MISLHANFIFIHRGKSAGNTITDALLPHATDNTKSIINPHQDGIDRFDVHNPSLPIRKHASLAEYLAILDEPTFDRLYKFSVIRNPYDRLISAYFHPVRVMKQGDTFDERKFINLINNQRTLREFTCLDAEDKLDTHLNRLLCFEHLIQDLQALMHDLNLPFTPPNHLNQSTRTHYSHYYTPATKALVESRFAEELDFGQYTF
ncbi:MAG: sulfotransferase family 2 domain-containing protein [Phycisphaerales bacterium]